MSVIRTSKLTKFYGKNCAIKDVDLVVEQGEVFGFIGPNGAGKSTTIRTLLGLVHASSGTAELFGKNIVTHGVEARRNIGYVPSEAFFYDGMTGQELLEYSAGFYRKVTAQTKARMHDLASQLDLQLQKKIDDLSYGNKKKLSIIQALLHEPQLIILDEPTGGLDPLVQQTFYKLLIDCNKKGTTIFLSSHVLSEVQKLCNRVAIIKQGSIIAEERIDTLRRASTKRVRLDFLHDKIPKKSDMHIAGVQDVQMQNGGMSFLYQGPVQPLLHKLSALPLANVAIEEPDLEEIFMHYYR